MIRRAFTFIEVMVLLVVVGVGLVGVIGLVSYGSTVASRAQAEAIGLSTAMSVAVDPTPLLDPLVASHWSHSGYALDTPDASATTSGFINGLYVTRTETSTPADIIAIDASGAVSARSARVEVAVSETIGGETVTAYVTRIVRQRKEP